MARRKWQNHSEEAKAIRDEWDALAKKKRADLVSLVQQQYRIIDTNGCDKHLLVYMILRARYGEAKITAAYR